ncbi:MAG: arginine--tRNA ligase [Planctomycetota bacterium]
MPDESSPTLDPVAVLAERFTEALRLAAPGYDGVIDPSISPSKRAELGDFQCNAAMGLAKRIGEKPRDLAARVVAAVKLDGIAEPVDEASIAGPGFINVRLRTDALQGLLGHLAEPDLGLPAPSDPATVVVDVCGVNLAKVMHVGHLRSTIIGDAVARLFERLGCNTVRQNHVGDWGLQIAMVVWKLSSLPASEQNALDLPAIETLYRAAQQQCSAGRTGLAIAKKFNHPKAIAEFEAEVVDSDAALAEAKAWLIKLQQGDQEAERLWSFVVDQTKAACLVNCARLKTAITDDSWAGESSYRDELDGVVEDLVSRGVATENDGALVVDVSEDGIKEPCLIRKSDGGYLYATTDVTAIRRRVGKLGGSRVVYCVDARQSLHFKQVFAAARKAGYADTGGGVALLEHAAFGTILGEDNKPFKTRSGESVKLTDLLDEASRRALETVREKNPDLPAEEAAVVAEAVAIAAIKYTDLSSERIKDYVFSLDRMLAFEGNTGPYLLYAATRLKSIARRAAEHDIDAAAEARDASFVITEPDEKQLALALLRYPRTVHAAAEAVEPSRLTAYCYDLATTFSGFYDRCPVLKPDPAVRGPRLKLCELTRRVLEDALHTLGIPAVERM